MVSQMEAAVTKANGQRGAQKTLSKNTSRDSKAIQSKKSNGRKPKEPTGTDIVPVMKLRAIDIVDNGSPFQITAGKGADGTETPSVFHMPGPVAQAAEKFDGSLPPDPSLVTDPELLELLQQLSETIDTANTVLDAAAEVGQPELETAEEAGNMDGGQSAPVPEQPVPEEDDLPLAAHGAGPPQNGSHSAKTEKAGLGLVANAALAGLILAAGGAWLVHTNPWLLDQIQEHTAQATSGFDTATSPDASKDQSALLIPAKTNAAVGKQKVASVMPAAPIMVPPSAEPVPMQTPVGSPDTTAAKDADTRPVRTSPGETAPLNVALGHASGASETSIMAQGLPDDTRLTKGKDLGSGNWLLSANDLDGLALAAGKNAKEGNHVIEFIAVKSDGSVPETRKIDVVVEKAPASTSAISKVQANAVASLPAAGTAVAKQEPVDEKPAGPTAKAEPEQLSPLSPAEVTALLTRGTRLMSEGDVAGARLLLEYAAQRGSKDAMVKLAESYDPQHLSKLPVRGVLPDAESAARWYDRAAKAGAR
mgnify:FL=1